jgi:xanthosine utilization system XapX-like protein
MIKRIALGGLIGALLGYIYYVQIGCISGTCPITSNPISSSIYGAILGALVLELIHDAVQTIRKNRIKKQETEN